MWNLMIQCLDNRTDARPKCKDIQRALANMNIEDSRTQLYDDFSEERKAHSNVEIDYKRLEMILVHCNVISSSLCTVHPASSDLPSSPNPLTTFLASSFSGGQSMEREDRVMYGTLASGVAGPVSATAPGSTNLTKMTSIFASSTLTKTANSTSKDEIPEEATLVRLLGKELKEVEEFVQNFAKSVVNWARMTSNVVGGLRIWALGFAKVIGLSADQGSEAFDAFIDIVEHELIPLCVDLEAVINERVVKGLAHLLMTMTQPLKLLALMNEQEVHHRRLMDINVSAKNRPPPALLAASTSYLTLRGRLATELPIYISLLHRGLKVSIYRLSGIQLDFYARVRDKWVCLWEMLRLEEELNVCAEETVDVWSARWREVDEVAASISVLQVRDCEREWERERENERKRESELGIPETDTECYTHHRLQAFAHHSPPISDHNHTRTQPSRFPYGHGPSSPPSPPPTDPPNSANSLTTSFTGSLYGGQSIEHAKDKDLSSQKPSGPIRSITSFFTPNKDSRNCSPTHAHISSRTDSVHSTHSTKSQSDERGRAKDRGSSSRKRSESIRSIASFFTGSSRDSRDHSPIHTRRHIPSRTSSVHSTHSTKSRDNSKHKRNKDKDPSSHKRSLSIQSITSFFMSNKDGHNTSPATAPQSTRDHTNKNAHTLSYSGDWTRKPSKYTCQVVHPCKVPTIGSKPLSYVSFPFFTLKKGEYYDVLQEAGHPSLHPDLPLIVEGEDCLLLCRDQEGSIGWTLASFLEPIRGVEE
ncbi:hypothetical protein P691DRAFT_701943 [Macrolepiota fuliginosa MF-IS2]|uniref:Uncharacterized protein n=1 Tax=Macrolepiota fuliginosa MF-IS2 TaxID=1400762 RepID=A0A9P5XG81_9AGAR|nr:hypothetical protein P691DRAFT_701943 [Macrolepiota fuliginosa MF-IS2]